MQEERNFNHTLAVENREKLKATGIVDVISFDEDMIVSETEMGILVVKGENLHINALNLEKGELDIDGLVFSMNYEEKGHSERNSFFGKIFK